MGARLLFANFVPPIESAVAMHGIEIQWDGTHPNTILVTFYENFTWRHMDQMWQRIGRMVREMSPQPVHIIFDVRIPVTMPPDTFSHLKAYLLDPPVKNHGLILFVAEWMMFAQIVKIIKEMASHPLEHVHVSSTLQDAYAIIKDASAY